MSGWNFAAVWETVARARPDGIAQIHGDRTFTWREFEARAGGLAGALREAGIGPQGKVALYLQNGPEYMEAAFAVLKAGLVPVNTNYRYGPDELLHLWGNADVEVVIFDDAFTPTIENIRNRCQAVRLWLRTGDGARDCPGWAKHYAQAATSGMRVTAEAASGDDLILIYTGGTTGLPKGVMWRQHDLYMAANTTGDPEVADLGHVAARIWQAEGFPVGLSAAPLMHGTGFVFATTILGRGGALVTLPERSFDPARLLDAIERHRVSDLCIVGDAFARPIAEELDRSPGRWDLSGLRVISSSGMAWSRDVKDRLLAHAPGLLLIDFLNSSEASGMGRSISSRRKPDTGGSDRFSLGRNAFVVDEDGAPMAPGDDRVGRLAVAGHVPLGYYKDAAKSAATFPVIDGVRCAVPGDYARLLPDGGIILLGRGSASINTGGEKVFAEEVETVIKTCPGVRDALVVGIPDDRFGQVVAALVEASGGIALSEDDIIAHVRAHLARYKAPRHVMIVSDLGRTVTGKADYPAARARLLAWLQAA